MDPAEAGKHQDTQEIIEESLSWLTKKWSLSSRHWKSIMENGKMQRMSWVFRKGPFTGNLRNIILKNKQP
jgi:hypothetical protein